MSVGSGDERVIVALNMTGQPRLVEFRNQGQEMLLSTYLDDCRSFHAEQIHLRADEGLLLRMPEDVA